MRKLLGFREKAKLAVIRANYQSDNEFRDYVTRYLTAFKQLLDEAAKREQGSMLQQTFLSSEVGMVYMMLTRALGREI